MIDWEKCDDSGFKYSDQGRYTVYLGNDGLGDHPWVASAVHHKFLAKDTPIYRGNCEKSAERAAQAYIKQMEDIL